MYFNHAFRKSFLGKTNGGVLDVRTSGSTADLTAGQIGLFDAKTFAAVTSTGKPFILAQGSYFTNDKIGPVHGGYQESVKSKVINPKYISRVFTTCSVQPQPEIKEICVSGLECGKTYRLRLDIKGSPALRFLSHNIYRTLDAFTGCCTDDCTATCTGALVDPTIATINWAKQIVENPIVKNYFKVTVIDWDGVTVAVQAGTSDAQIAAFVAALNAYTSTFDPTDANADTDDSCIRLEVAYVDTKFGNCTFTPTDFYELQPLRVFASMVDETGDPCSVQGVTISGQVNADGVATPPFQEPRQAQGLGETVLRDLILAGRYRQEAFPDSSRVESLRMREIEGNPSLTGFNRNAYFNSINILHNVPRLNNPTGTFDNDQYLLTIYVPEGVDNTAFLNSLQTVLNCAGNGIEIENWNINSAGELEVCSDVNVTTVAGGGCVTNPAITTTTTTAAPTTTTTTAAP
jgi:hypothetical protein